MIVFLSRYGHDRLFFSQLVSTMPYDVATNHLHMGALSIQYILEQIPIRQCKTIVVWNGLDELIQTFVLPKLLKATQVIYFEHGYLSRTVQIDTKGVNAGSSIVDTINDDFLLSLSLDRHKLKKVYTEGFTQRDFPKDTPVILDDTNDNDPLPGKFWLFPLQVFDDSNLTFYGNGWTNESAIEDTLKYLPKDTTLVVKEHPSDYGRKDYASFRAKYPNLHWIRSKPVRELIEKSELVVTINSSVGVEGLRCKKQVRVLGHSAFARIANEHSGTNPALVARYLYWLRWHYLIKTNPFALTDGGNVQAVQRILDIVEGKEPWLDGHL